ncbi:MAG: WD40 repeat domain-containing protein [Aggregatilineales bacterium]
MGERARQLKRERALFCYISALERGDIDTVAAILHDAASDAALERMILEYHAAAPAEHIAQEAASPFGPDQPAFSYPPSVSANGSVRKELDHMTVYAPTANVAAFPTDAERRSLPLTLWAAVFALAICGGLLLYAAGRLSTNPAPDTAAPVGLLQADETPEPPTPEPEAGPPVISAANVQQLTLLNTITQEFLSGLLAWSPDRQLMAASAYDGIFIYNTDTFALPRMLSLETSSITKLLFSPDSSLIAVLDDTRVVQLYDLTTGQRALEISGHDNRVVDVAFSPDGALVATTSIDKTVRLWDTATGREVRRLEFQTNPGYSVAFSPDGTAIAVGSGDIRLWDVASGRQIATFALPGLIVPVTSKLVFSGDGAVIAAAQGRYIRLWDVASGRQLLEIEDAQASGLLHDFALSQDETLIAAARGTVVQLWDARSGALLRTLEGADRSIMTVAFSPDGTKLAFGVGGSNSLIWLWGVAAGQGDA